MIINALVTDVVPDYRVKAAMNEINASRKMKEATLEKAEGEKVEAVLEKKESEDSLLERRSAQFCKIVTSKPKIIS